MTAIASAIAIALATGCGGASTQHVVDVSSAEGLFASRAEGARALTPTLVAEAKLELEAARRAVAEGDEATAALRAQRSIAAMQRAFVVARLTRASQEEALATAAAGASAEALQKLRAERARVDTEVDELEKKLHIAREIALPGESPATDPARAEARLRAARSLLAEARLLCGAARLVNTQAKGLDEAEAGLRAAGELIARGAPRVAGPRPTSARPGAAPHAREPVDVAGQSRVACLAVLTQARRATEAAARAPAEDPDVLFAELAAAAAQRAEAGPVRDERGVMRSYRDVFQGNELNEAGKQALAAAALVARAHASVSVQLVVHDADAATTPTSERRLEASLKALEANGVARERLRGDLAGNHLQIVPPSDAARRARNARLDVVFVHR